MPSPDSHSRVSHEIEIRFYAELNDFLPSKRLQRAFRFTFHGTPSVKDTIEAIGVPHTEVDVILVDDRSVSFDHLLQGGEHVAVYPVFEQCRRCHRVYWRGSHLRRLNKIIERARNVASRERTS